MAKWFGVIGYAKTVEVEPGIHKEQIITRKYYGDVKRISRRLQSSDQVNDHIDISNEISIIADPFAEQHFHSIRYIEWQGAKWTISNAEVVHPRLNLTIGGLYNDGEQA